jgi:hypothetical protein
LAFAAPALFWDFAAEEDSGGVTAGFFAFFSTGTGEDGRADFGFSAFPARGFGAGFAAARGLAAL